MIPKWTGDIVKIMHLNSISTEELATKLGVTRTWVSKILNGKVRPKNAREKFKAAVTELAAEKGND